MSASDSPVPPGFDELNIGALETYLQKLPQLEGELTTISNTHAADRKHRFWSENRNVPREREARQKIIAACAEEVERISALLHVANVKLAEAKETNERRLEAAKSHVKACNDDLSAFRLIHKHQIDILGLMKQKAEAVLKTKRETQKCESQKKKKAELLAGPPVPPPVPQQSFVRSNFISRKRSHSEEPPNSFRKRVSRDIGTRDL